MYTQHEEEKTHITSYEVTCQIAYYTFHFYNKSRVSSLLACFILFCKLNLFIFFLAVYRLYLSVILTCIAYRINLL